MTQAPVVPSSIAHLDFDPIIDLRHDDEKERTCELKRYPTKNRCSRRAAWIVSLVKPCGHLNDLLLCEPCWDGVVEGSISWLSCGRCKEMFVIQACIVGAERL